MVDKKSSAIKAQTESIVSEMQADITFISEQASGICMLADQQTARIRSARHEVENALARNRQLVPR